MSIARSAWGIAAVFTCAAAAAQTIQPTQAAGSMRHYTLNYATGELKADTEDLPPVEGFANIAFANQFAGPTNGDEWVDYGVKNAGLSDVVTSFVFGYATTRLDPSIGGPGGSIGIAFYSGTLGRCTVLAPASLNPGQRVGSYTFTGLPGTTMPGTPVANSVQVDISSSAFALADGPIGWSYFDVGDGSATGPLLVFPQSNGGSPNTGTIDSLDRYRAPAHPTRCLGPFRFGSGQTSSGIASLYMAITEDDGSVSAVVTPRNGTGINPNDYSAFNTPIVGTTWTANVATTPGTTATFILFSTGSDSMPFAGGELLIDVTPHTVDAAMGMHNVQVPLDANLIGGVVYTQAVRAEATFCVLLNALDITVGH